MKLFTSISLLLFIQLIVYQSSFAYKPSKTPDNSLRYVLLNPTQLINLSYRDYITLTGKKPGLLNRLSFMVFKNNIKKENTTKNKSVQTPKLRQRSTFMKILAWTIGICLVLLLILALLYSGAKK